MARSYNDEQLEQTLASSRSWRGALRALGLSATSASAMRSLRQQADRLGLDYSHFTGQRRWTAHLTAGKSPPPVRGAQSPRMTNLPRAGSLLAAAWFELCGRAVSWPVEPCRYDLLVWMERPAERIQVKTTRLRTGTSWTVSLSTTGKSRRTYAPDEVDQFFVIDGDLSYYLLPLHVVGGLTAIRLAAYEAYRLPQL